MSDRRRETLRMIREDCRADAKRYDGLPLTGKTVAEINGHTLAMISSLTHILESILEAEDE